MPPLNPFLDLNKVQQLFLSCNRLADDVIKIISGYRRLRVLDLAYNLIRNLDDWLVFSIEHRILGVIHIFSFVSFSFVDKLQFLEEINLSRNKLISLPQTLASLPKLTSLKAHSNRLTTIPDFSQCSNLKVIPDIDFRLLKQISLLSFFFKGPRRCSQSVGDSRRKILLSASTETFGRFMQRSFAAEHFVISAIKVKHQYYFRSFFVSNFLTVVPNGWYH